MQELVMDGKASAWIENAQTHLCLAEANLERAVQAEPDSGYRADIRDVLNEVKKAAQSSRLLVPDPQRRTG
jgi:hypothetical protein